MFWGMVTESGRTHVDRMRQAHVRIDEIVSGLDSTIGASDLAWRGPDAEGFRADWASLRSSLIVSCLTRLADFSGALDEDVAGQEQASTPDPGEQHTTASTARDTSDAMFDYGDEQDVDPQVADAWESLSQEEREKVAQEIADDTFAQYGMDPVAISFEDLPEGSYGSWSEESQTLVVNSNHLEDPEILKTVAHEVRHAAQHEFVEQTEPTGWWLWKDDKSEVYEQLEDDHGITREDITPWRANQEDGAYVSPPDAPPADATEEQWEAYRREFAYYEGQPVEVDARGAGDRLAEDYGLDDLVTDLEDAGVS